MSCVKFTILQQCIIHRHSCLFVFPYWLCCSLHSFLEIRIVIIVTKEKDRALRHPYQTHAKARIMSEIDEVQEQMKADMEAMKEQMTTMMEIMMSMRKMMKDNTTTIIVVSTATEMDSIHPPDFNKVNRPVSDVVGQGGKAVKNEYGLPPNYTPPTIVYDSGENISNFAIVLI